MKHFNDSEKNISAAASLAAICRLKSYFLQLYFGFTPNLAQAAFNGDPAGTSIFFPPELSTVMCRLNDVLPAAVLVGKNAIVDVSRHMKVVIIERRARDIIVAAFLCFSLQRREEKKEEQD